MSRTPSPPYLTEQWPYESSILFFIRAFYVHPPRVEQAGEHLDIFVFLANEIGALPDSNVNWCLTLKQLLSYGTFTESVHTISEHLFWSNVVQKQWISMFLKLHAYLERSPYSFLLLSFNETNPQKALQVSSVFNLSYFTFSLPSVSRTYARLNLVNDRLHSDSNVCR